MQHCLLETGSADESAPLRAWGLRGMVWVVCLLPGGFWAVAHHIGDYGVQAVTVERLRIFKHPSPLFCCIYLLQSLPVILYHHQLHSPAAISVASPFAPSKVFPLFLVGRGQTGQDRDARRGRNGEDGREVEAGLDL